MILIYFVIKLFNMITHFYVLIGNKVVKAYDVAMNSEFFNKCQNDDLFQSFIVSATIEGVAEKFKIGISLESKVYTHYKLYFKIIFNNYIFFFL